MNDFRELGTEDLYSSLLLTLLGQEPHLSRRDVSALSGVDPDRARDLWQSLGFPPATDEEEVLFVDGDVAALRSLEKLLSLGMIDQQAESAISRTVGRTFARLAEWEVAELADTVLKDAPELDLPLLQAIADELLPVLEQVHSHVWRRHLVSAAGRLLVRGGPEESIALSVGFVDVVGYTRRTRSMSTEELEGMVETFEQVTTATVVDHGGRVIKTIGDEVLFVCDDPDGAARIALALAERHDTDEEFPQVRCGLGHGEVLERYGDVFGEPVNIAARLTSLARPGRVLINRALADAVDHEQVRVRRWRIVPVKGYTRLEAWSLRRPRPPRE